MPTFDIANRLANNWEERVTQSPKFIDTDHAYIHEGIAFEASVLRAEVNSTGKYVIKTPSTGYIHYRPTFVSVAKGNVISEIWEDTTSTGVGSAGSTWAAVTPYNRKRTSTSTSNSLVYSEATSTGGTMIDRWRLWGSTGAGGSGGGASGRGGSGGAATQTGTGATAFYGNTGGSAGGQGGGGGGGGAGGVGSSGGSNGGTGGIGTSAFSAWGAATSSGQNISGTYWYAGGGGGSTRGASPGAGGSGGGGNGNYYTTNNGSSGTVNTGGGGGGNDFSGPYLGGSGIIILRYSDSKPDLTSIDVGLTFTKYTTGGYKYYKFTAGTGTVTI